MTFPLEDTCHYQDWHLLAAIPLGLLSGLITSLGLIVTAMARTIRTHVSERLFHTSPQQQQQVPQQPSNGDVPSLIFPTLAGLINGLAATCLTPYVLGGGIDVMRDLLQQAVHHQNNNTNTTIATTSYYSTVNESEPDGGLLSPDTYILIALTKLVAFSMSLGFGMVGGPVVPSLFVGLCLGLAMTSAFISSTPGGWTLPLSLTVPCCMAATAGSMVPTPFALIGTVYILFALQPTQMGPVLVATMVAFGVTGGLGFLRQVAETRLGVDRRTNRTAVDNDLDDTDHLHGEHEHSEVYVSPLPSDEEILKGVRSAIFGT
jgi:H+/Cl- antiporter ClcA